MHGITLWRLTMFDQTEQPEDFEGFKLSSEKVDAADLIRFPKGMNTEVAKDMREDDIMERMNCDSEAPVVWQMMDEEIVDMVINPNKENNYDGEEKCRR